MTRKPPSERGPASSSPPAAVARSRIPRSPFPVPGGGGVIPPHGGSAGGYHFAFSIAAEDVEPWHRRLEAEGVAVESVVSWPGGAKSIYFRDPDENLAELITAGFWAID